MQRAPWIAVAIALIASSARADVSSWCLWTQLYDLHAVETRCAGKPSSAAEAGFERLRKATAAAVLRDAALHAGASAESASAEMAQYAAKRRPIDAKRCEDPDLKRAVTIFETLGSSDKVTRLTADLANRRDPYEGDCL
jgi:hypothetical protein